MFTNLSEKYKSIIEHRIDTQFFIYHNIQFWSLEFSEIELFNLDNFVSKRNIVILNEDIEVVNNIDKFRKLVSSCYLFTKHNLLKKYGIPESTFYFNCLIDDTEYFVSNNNNRVSDIIYDIDKVYLSSSLNETNNIIIKSLKSQITDQNKLLYDIVAALCCGCSVFIEDVNILNNLDSDDSVFINTFFNESDRLKAQEHFHFKYGYSYQSDHIKNQLVGILGDYISINL